MDVVSVLGATFTERRKSVSDFQVVKVHPHLIAYVDSLQKKNAESLSFYPRCVFERESERGRIFLGLLNGAPCGYLYAGAVGPDVKCHQVCIEYDARRKLYGAALVQVMEDYAREAFTLTLRCGFDLDANVFWSEMGYKCVGSVTGGIRRQRTINIWRKVLTQELLVQPHTPPATGKTDASFWRKHKQTGLVTQFARGKTLKDYRATLVSNSLTQPKP